MFLLNSASIWSLLTANLIVAALAVKGNISMSELLWIYWGQSVIIGIFNFFRILLLKNFSAEGLLMNGRPLNADTAGKIYAAVFFLFHYGFFHLIYAVFLIAFGAADRFPDPWTVLSAVSLFFINHLFSFIYNRRGDMVKENLGRLMFFPYIRIIPMHLTIILGGVAEGGIFPKVWILCFFLALKTLADVIMHVIEHKESGAVDAQDDACRRSCHPPAGSF